MKALLFHASEYGVNFHSFANRPKDVFCEPIDGKKEQKCKNCVVAFVTVEKGDVARKVSDGISKEIVKMCGEIKRKSAAIVPFAHLSNNLEEPKKSFDILERIEKKVGKKGIRTLRSHFGSNKSLHLDVYGHVGNARYREF